MRIKKTYIPKSSIKAICASKMFMSSRNQDKILSALEDPTNIELVKQLDEYIGDEYKELLKPKTETKEVDKDTTQQAETNQEDANDADNTDTQEDDFGIIESPDDLAPVVPITKDAEDESDTQDAKKDVEQPVENSTSVNATTIIMHPEYEDAVNEIKGRLNANSDTAGVSRVQKKDDEIWIYYKDSVNLNNLMDAVIDSLTQGYLWLMFNRLARSENAMVFTVLYDDTDKALPNGNER